jgi:probable HAF family extracellular repeat protein
MRRHWKRTLALLGVVAATGLVCAAVALGGKRPPQPPTPPQPTVRHEIHFLGRLPGDAGSYALDVNDDGVVLGHSWYPDLGWRPWVIVPEDTDGDGIPDLWYRDTEPDGADGVNDLMVLVNDLIDPDSGWNLRQVWGINNAGQIVGYAYNANGEIRAYRLTPGAPAVVEELGTLPGDVMSRGFSINDDGHVVGESSGSGTSRAFLYKDWDGYGTEEMRDIGHLGGGTPQPPRSAILDG